MAESNKPAFTLSGAELLKSDATPFRRTFNNDNDGEPLVAEGIPPASQWRLSDFEVRPTAIGHGALSAVYLCRLKAFDESPFFAMKIMKKQELVRLRQAERVVREAAVHEQVTKKLTAHDAAAAPSPPMSPLASPKQRSDLSFQHLQHNNENNGEHQHEQQHENNNDPHNTSDVLLSNNSFASSAAVVIEEQQQRQRRHELARAAAGRQFVVTLHRAFADERRVYFILEHAQGGELFARLRQESKFPLEVARFYIAEIILAIDYLHTCERVVFRDLNPENILLDAQGHIKLCDFGNAKCLAPTPEQVQDQQQQAQVQTMLQKQQQQQRSTSSDNLDKGEPTSDKRKDTNNANSSELLRTFSICGVPEYVAPEIAAVATGSSNNASATNGNSSGSTLFQGHSFPVDWWAVGVILFEMLCGYPPFFDDVPHKIFEKAANASRQTIPFPQWLDPRAQDLIVGLLTPDPSRRLGSLKRGVVDIMKHRFFVGLDWSALRHRQVPAPDFVRTALSPVVMQSSTLKRAQKVLEQPAVAAEVMRRAALAAASAAAHQDEDEEADKKKNEGTSDQQQQHNKAKAEITAQILELQLCLPFDKYPESGDQQQPGAGTTSGDAQAKIGKAVAGVSSLKPLTEQQQALFAVFSEN